MHTPANLGSVVIGVEREPVVETSAPLVEGEEEDVDVTPEQTDHRFFKCSPRQWGVIFCVSFVLCIITTGFVLMVVNGQQSATTNSFGAVGFALFIIGIACLVGVAKRWLRKFSFAVLDMVEQGGQGRND